jgi:hypothetical protein
LNWAQRPDFHPGSNGTKMKKKRTAANVQHTPHYNHFPVFQVGHFLLKLFTKTTTPSITFMTKNRNQNLRQPEKEMEVMAEVFM